MALLLSALPAVLIQAIAGLALLTTVSDSLQRSLKRPQHRDTAIVTFLITASGLSIAGIGAAFWGLLGGLVCHLLLRRR